MDEPIIPRVLRLTFDRLKKLVMLNGRSNTRVMPVRAAWVVERVGVVLRFVPGVWAAAGPVTSSPTVRAAMQSVVRMISPVLCQDRSERPPIRSVKRGEDSVRGGGVKWSF